MTIEKRPAEHLALAKPILVATIAHSIQPFAKKVGEPECVPASYGIILTFPDGSQRTLNAAVYATCMDQVVCLAIARLLREFPDFVIHVHCAKNLREYFGPGGHLRRARRNGGKKANGEPFVGYPMMSPLLDALDANQWVLNVSDNMWDAPDYVTARCEADNALTVAVNHHKTVFATEVGIPQKPEVIWEGR
ncbi:hypothetical protein DRY87_24515, partial [Salmonella enterica subsp. enterica serovar Newport]|nr:hypothetical protein [Salmonella enterica subsp. enterica serovar Newport]